MQEGTVAGRRIDVPGLGHAYKWLVMWFGIQLLATVAGMILTPVFRNSSTGAGLLAVYSPIGVLVAIGAMAYYAFRTAQALRSRVPLLWALALVVPLVNVLSLLALSQKATRACRANGVAVGFLGPKLSE